MRLSRILMFMGAVALSALPVAAQGRAGGKPAGVGKPTTTTAKGPQAPKAPTTTGGSTHGKSADHAKSGETAKSGDTAKGGGKSADHAKNADAKNGTTTTTTTTTETTDTTTTNGRGQLALKDRIEANPTLKARVTAVIGDMSLTDATAGWKNQGQLIAAVNAVEHNPGITFASLQTEMTGPNQLSLGQAMKKLNAAAATPTTTTGTTTTTTTTTSATTTP